MSGKFKASDDFMLSCNELALFMNENFLFNMYKNNMKYGISLHILCVET